MQSIQRDIGEVQVNLGKLADLSLSDADYVGQSIVILETTWRYANDYIEALPTLATPFRNKAED